MIGTEFVASIAEGCGTGMADGAEMLIGFAPPGTPPPPGSMLGMPGVPALDGLGIGGAMPGISKAVAGLEDGIAADCVEGVVAG